MAYAFQNFSTFNPAGAVAFDAGVGLVVPHNHLTAAAAGFPRWNTAGTTVAADASASGFPASQGHDGFLHKTTKPSGLTTLWYYVVDFGAGTEVTIDSALIVHKQLGAAQATTVKVQIADSGDFLTAPITIADSGVVPAAAAGKIERRLGFYQLDHGIGQAQVYTSVRFLRFEFSRVGPGNDPEIHEFVVGQRAQLLVNPLAPFDADGNVSNAPVFEARSGAARIYEFYRGKGVFSAGFTTGSVAEFAPLADIWLRSNQGTKHVVWVPCPESAPAESFLMRIDPPEFEFPFVAGTHVRTGRWDLIEQGPPFVARER